MKTRERRAPSARDRLLGAAAQLFQEQGYAATGLSEILERGGAPKGSLYHYFPEGKAQLAAAALQAAGSLFESMLRDLYAQSGAAAPAVIAFAEQLAGWLERSGFSRGCPIATVALEQGGAENEVGDTVRGIFAAWREELETMLIQDGLSAEAAKPLALFVLSSLEGALMLARVDRDASLVRIAGDQAAATIRAALARP